MGVCISNNIEFTSVPITIDSLNAGTTASSRDNSCQSSPIFRPSLQRPILHKLIQKRVNSFPSLEKDNRNDRLL